MTSPLKAAFAESRAQKNIDLVLPVWKTTPLYVVVAETRPAGKKPDFFLAAAPTPERKAITVSDKLENLAKITWPKQMLTGAEILEHLAPDFEVIVVHDDGGDYLTREQLAWFRSKKD